MRILSSLLFVASCLAADLPSGESLIQKAFEVTGGEKTTAKFKATTMSGKLEMGGGSLVGTVLMYQADGKSYTTLELPGIGKVEEGFDGQTAWEMSALQGVRVKEGAERDLSVRGAKLTPLSGWRDSYTAVKTIGEEDVDGQPAWKVEMTPTTGKPEIFYLDKKSGLPVRMSMSMPTAMGEIAVDQRLGDYRMVTGVQTPFLMVMNAMNQVMTMKFDKVSYEESVPEGRFDLPAAVKTMVERRKNAPR